MWCCAESSRVALPSALDVDVDVAEIYRAPPQRAPAQSDAVALLVSILLTVPFDSHFSSISLDVETV